jgi:ferric-dicitrate binding protein FerR (iron transport regulator)
VSDLNHPRAFPSPAPKTISTGTLDRHLSGNATATDATAFADWIQHTDDGTSVVSALLSCLPGAPNGIDPDVDVAAERLMAAGPGRSASTRRASSSARASRGSFKHYRGVIAALVVIAVPSVVGMRALLGGHDSRHTFTHTYHTAAGERRTISFGDGSRMTLGPATTVEVATSNANGTSVQVQGQALFAISHKPSYSFIVRTANATTRVLGTTFMVRRYENERQTSVVVTDGRVSVNPARRGAQAYVLSPQTLGVIDDSGTVHVTPNVAADDYTTWTTGLLTFVDRPVSDVATELGRTYAANIRVDDELLARKEITWGIETTHQSLYDALEQLSTMFDIRVTVVRPKDGGAGVYVLVPAHRPTHVPSRRSHSLSAESQYGK